MIKRKLLIEGFSREESTPFDFGDNSHGSLSAAQLSFPINFPFPYAFSQLQPTYISKKKKKREGEKERKRE